MSYHYVKTWRHKTKQMLVDGMGGKCNRCGYDVCLACLDFHHLGGKDGDVSHMISGPVKLERIIAEVKKCVVLCKNCHHELHNGVWNIAEISPCPFDETRVVKKKMPLCQHCNKNPVTNSRYRFCSEECREKSRTKRIPDASRLQHLLWQVPTTQIAEQFGVSDKAVEKWAKKYGLEKPPRGYWTKRSIRTNG